MKARIKSTGEIVDVDFDKEALANDYPPYSTNEIPSRFFLAEQLEWIDIKEKVEPDYWEKLKHQYAGMAMQGMLNNSLLITSLLKVNKSHEDIVAEVTSTAIRYAHVLVEKYKKEEK
mgnify:CR=1 FL=1